MDTKNIEKDGVIDIDAVSADQTDTISEEEFRELATLRAMQLNLKDKGYNLFEYLEINKAQYEEASKQLVEVRSELEEVGAKIQSRFTEVLEPLGFAGANVTLNDTPDENGRYKVYVVPQ